MRLGVGGDCCDGPTLQKKDAAPEAGVGASGGDIFETKANEGKMSFGLDVLP